MTTSFPFTFHRSPFTMRYPFTVYRGVGLMDNGKCMVNSEWLMANSSDGAV